MSVYRYLATDILTGEVLFDNLPVVVQGISAQLNGIGSLSGTLQLYKGLSETLKSDIIAAIEPFRSVFWAFQDDIPIWAGPVVSWSPSTLVGSQLPFQAATMETMFQYRLISDNLNYTLQDVATVVRSLATYALTKGHNSQIAGFDPSGPNIDIVDSIIYTGSYYQSVYDAWNTLVQAYNFEFAIQPVMTSATSLGFKLLIGAPLMRPYSQTGIQFVYPSANAVDYAWARQTNSVGNYLYVTATTASSSGFQFVSQPPNGIDQAEFNAGYPLLESTVSMQQPVTEQSDVDNYANSWLLTSSLTGQTTPVITLGPNSYPRISDLILGDECMFAATSAIHPGNQGKPGVIFDGRITGWNITPPSQGNPENIQLNLCANGSQVQ
jgi:hypothetical protein